jgi:hypothetical protein
LIRRTNQGAVTGADLLGCSLLRHVICYISPLARERYPCVSDAADRDRFDQRFVDLRLARPSNQKVCAWPSTPRLSQRVSVCRVSVDGAQPLVPQLRTVFTFKSMTVGSKPLSRSLLARI